jgi:hypothetical protein
MAGTIERRAVWAPTFEELWVQTSAKLPPKERWRLVIARSALPMKVKAVAQALATFMDLNGVAYPSLPAIRERSGASRTTVKEALNALEDGGWLVREKGGGRRKTTRYSIPKQAATRPLSDGNRPPHDETGRHTTLNRPPHGPEVGFEVDHPEVTNESQCVYCGAHAPMSGWTWTHYGRVCGHHNTATDAGYARWAAANGGAE